MWEAEVNKILSVFATKRLNGRVASDLTQEKTKDVVYASFRKLHALGYKIQNPTNITEKHIKVLVEHWWFVMGKKPKTIRNDLSRLRIFFGWIGKQGFIRGVTKYLPSVDPKELAVHSSAIRSKSWAENGIDISQKFHEAVSIDLRFGLMIIMMGAFGLRPIEAIKCKPWVADREISIRIFPGDGKGTRPRDIPIDTLEQRRVLDYVKSHVGKTKELGWELTKRGKRATEYYQVKRFQELMVRIGITKAQANCTAMGLRAQYAENTALLMGFIPPTLNGNNLVNAKEDFEVKRMVVSQNLGHSRSGVTGAYYGRFPRHQSKETDENQAQLFKTAASIIRSADANLPEVAYERQIDCLKILEELLDHNNALHPREVQYLWTVHSRRFGSDWINPANGILQAMEAAAWSILKAEK